MKVKRTVTMKVNNFEIGDQINVKLPEYEKYTATAHEITDKGTLFIFDDCVCAKPMNNENTNEGGYLESDLRKFVTQDLLKAFPDKLLARMVKDDNGDLLSIPTYGQIFGKDWDDEWDQKNIEIDQREQLPLMEKRKNRIANLNGKWRWYWLQNKIRSSSGFAGVLGGGDASGNGASHSRGSPGFPDPIITNPRPVWAWEWKMEVN